MDLASLPHRRPQLPALTGLRFFAAISVVVFHYQLGERPLHLPALLIGWSRSGYEAVTFFFVLSGFILAYVHAQSSAPSGMNVPLGRFWLARAARILPAHWLGLAIGWQAFFYAWSRTHVLGLHRFLLSLGLTPVLLQAWVPTASFSWNPPSWSLSVEIFFYACFPLLVLVLRRVSPWRALLFSYLGVAIVAAIRWRLDLIGGDLAWGYFRSYFPLFHLSQFVFGMALALVATSWRKEPAWRRPLAFSLGLLGLAVVLGWRPGPLWTRLDWICAPLFGLVVLGAALPKPRGLGWLCKAPWPLLGEASYALYLLHSPIRFWWLRTLHIHHVVLPRLLDFSLYTGLCVAASIASFLWFETPVRRWLMRRFSTPRPGERGAPPGTAESFPS